MWRSCASRRTVLLSSRNPFSTQQTLPIYRYNHPLVEAYRSHSSASSQYAGKATVRLADDVYGKCCALQNHTSRHCHLAHEGVNPPRNAGQYSTTSYIGGAIATFLTKACTVHVPRMNQASTSAASSTYPSSESRAALLCNIASYVPPLPPHPQRRAPLPFIFESDVDSGGYPSSECRSTLLYNVTTCRRYHLPHKHAHYYCC